MKLSRPSLALAVSLAALLAASIGLAAEHMDMPPMKSTPAFDKMKALAGHWEGQTPDGHTVKVDYQVVSGGSCVMETLSPPDGMTMVSMYHLDGTKIVMDHYCDLNNVPHLKGTFAADGKSLSFVMVSATNLASPKDRHMSGVKLGFEDADHLTHEWTLHVEGKDQPVVFKLQRGQ